MGQFWFGILIIAIAAAMGWWGTQVASEGWKNWKHPALSSEKAVGDIKGGGERCSI
jgi:TRAP-type C4-dicarboxylate transport system permease small subunit